MGLALKKLDNVIITGWDISESHCKEALSLKLVDKIAPSETLAMADADVIFLAIPVDVIEIKLSSWLDLIRSDQIILDLGSTKEKIARSVIDHKNRKNYIAAHPISGTEYSGPKAAIDHLYQGKTMIICDEERSDGEKVTQMKDLFESIGMHLTSLSSHDHDKHLAYVSHLSHAIAYSLSRTVLKEEEGDNRILDLAGSGFDSTVRLAKSSPEMWTPIFLKNREFLLEAIDNFMGEVQKLRQSIEDEDSESVKHSLTQSREIRKILK